MSYLSIKRILDLLLSVLSVILLSPIFLLISIWIKIESKGPVFFTQTRLGVNKSHFQILKFRTMRVETPKNMPTHLLENPEQWITNSGYFLRKTSLDELPQLFNIIKGEMSIIGPRPALWNQHDLVKERDKYNVNLVKPGLTGLAQINGRDENDIESKAILDSEYCRNITFSNDVRLFFNTVISVLKSEGVVEGKQKK